tara:strand:- start:167 stop:490 length:324 start_codon:yes stop_codon:yes gene_type:complete
MAFTIKKGDTSPSIQSILKDSAGVPINITGATVKFHMKPIGSSTLKVDQVMTIVDATGGIVRYSWEDSDTDTVGTYYAEFEVTRADNSTETFPNNSNAVIVITKSLG